MNRKLLERFVPKNQLIVMIDNLKGEEGGYFKEALAKTEKMILDTPELYSTEELGDSAPIRLHYFYGGIDIYITELDRESGEMFGFACLNGDRFAAELGYFDSESIVASPLMNLDLHMDEGVTIGDIKKSFAG